MSKHTPGPWKFKRVNNAVLAKNSSVNLLTDGEGFNLGLLSTWRDSPESEMEAEANARLIAAAPDLLEALEAAMAFIGSHAADPDLTSDMRAKYAALQDLNPAGVIASARGEA